MRSVSAALVVVAAILQINPVLSADDSGHFLNLGQGTKSCETWSADAATTEKYLERDTDRQWVLGFLTAYGTYVSRAPDITGGTNNAGLIAWVDNYCAARPSDQVVFAAKALVHDLTLKNGVSAKSAPKVAAP